jgi:hypothetical protein
MRTLVALTLLAAVVAAGWLTLRPGGSDPVPWDTHVADGDRVRLTYTGSECRDGASVEVEEGDDRVVLTVWETDHSRSCSDVGVTYDVAADLAEPLGDRALVDGACAHEANRKRTACR